MMIFKLAIDLYLSEVEPQRIKVLCCCFAHITTKITLPSNCPLIVGIFFQLKILTILYSSRKYTVDAVGSRPYLIRQEDPDLQPE